MTGKWNWGSWKSRNGLKLEVPGVCGASTRNFLSNDSLTHREVVVVIGSLLAVGL